MPATSLHFRGLAPFALFSLALDLLFVSLISSPALFAQGASASIQGTVSDAQPEKMGFELLPALKR